MTTKQIDQTKNEQATNLIVAEIAKLPANKPMESNTIGALLGHTQREGKAHSLATYFVERMYQVDFGPLPQNWDAETKEMSNLANTIAVNAINQVGK